MHALALRPTSVIFAANGKTPVNATGAKGLTGFSDPGAFPGVAFQPLGDCSGYQ